MKNPLDNLEKDKKNYYVNELINSKNFPRPKKIETKNPVIIKMDKSFTSEEALAKIRAEGCRPANIYEMLALKKDKLEKRKWYLAFGDDFRDADGYHRVPYLFAYSDGDFRWNLGDFGRPWPGDLCLLCFRDKTLTARPSENFNTLTLPSELIINGIKYIKQ